MSEFTKSFLLILSFFTRLPVRRVEYTDALYRKGVKLMPLAGLVVGAILFCAGLLMAALNIPEYLRAALIVFAYIFITGGLHFDGLADTCDGVFSGRTREQSLEIMKDSRIGVFGTLGIFIAGLLYFAAFTALPAAAFLAFPVCGRACCLISASAAPYARSDGMGKATEREGGGAAIFAAVCSVAAVSFLVVLISLGGARLAEGCGYAILSRTIESAVMPGAGAVFPAAAVLLIAAGVSFAVTICMTASFKKKLGGVTGDTFGAVIEISSVVYLLVCVVLFENLPMA